jgi:hypothetical protein
MTRRLSVIALVAIGVLLAGGVTLMIASQRSDPYPAPQIGSVLPVITVMDGAGKSHMLQLPNGPTVVMILRESCSHCRAQLSELERQWVTYPLKSLILITYEKGDLAQTGVSSIASFARKRSLAMGFTDPKSVLRAFGSLDTPMFFVYDADGKLRNIHVGETPVRQLYSELGMDRARM